MLDKIIEEINIQIKACRHGLTDPEDEDAYLNKIQAYNQTIRIIKSYQHTNKAIYADACRCGICADKPAIICGKCASKYINKRTV